jgi:RNA polymerase sigma-70 factor (ECF subfamily)
MQPNLLCLGVGRDGHREASLRHEGTNLGTNSLDSQEFESFFRAHEPAVSGFLYRMVGDTHSASDLSQETFFRAWQRFPQIRSYHRPEAWLFRVATNLALQHLRQRAAPIGWANALDAQFEPSESDPGRRFAVRDLVCETLLELPPRPRALLVLREAYGFTAEEAASALGMSLTAAKVALWRARTQFRVIYLRKDGQE